MAEPFHEMTSLTYAEKETRIRLLTALLDDYQGDDAITSSAAVELLTKSRDLCRQLGLDKDASTVDAALATLTATSEPDRSE